MRGGDGDRGGRRSPYLPTGYRMDEEADFSVLRREDDSEAAVFSATGAESKEIERRLGRIIGAGRAGGGLEFRLRAASRPVSKEELDKRREEYEREREKKRAG